MKTSKEYHALLAKLEEAGRTYKGLWSAFSHAEHHGMATFAAYEAAERMKYAEQIAQHLAEHEEHVQYGAIAAPACDYKTPADAMKAACKVEDELENIAKVTHHAVVQSNERPYFLSELIRKMKHERKEVAGVKSMLAHATTEEQVAALNQSLLEKYSSRG